MKRWTKEETNTLLELSKKFPLPEIAHRLNRPYGAVHSKVTRLGIQFKESQRHRRWTEREEELLTEWLGEIPIWKIAQKLKRNRLSVYRKCQGLELSTKTELDGWSSTQFARLIGVHRDTVTMWIRDGKLKAEKLSKNQVHRHVITRRNFTDFYYQYHQSLRSLKRIPPEVLEWILDEKREEGVTYRYQKGDRYWTPEKDALLRQWAGRVPIPELPEKVGKSKVSIRNRATKLKISLKYPQ